MMPSWPEFPVTVVGSWPRPSWLLEARKRRRPDLSDVEDEAVLLAIKYQEDAGVDIVTDGEQRRDNFYSFLCERVEGFRLMTMADLLDHVEDKAGFETLLRTLDVPAYAIKNPTVVGKIRATRPLVLDDFEFMRRHTRRAIKVTLPGPYLLSRSSWVQALSASAYPTREALANDVVELLRSELIELAQRGCDVVQFDEPVLTELVFAGKSATRTFMCAALAAASSPEQELEFAVDLMNRVVAGVDGPVKAVHVCRGNWSRDDGVLLEGSYDALIPYLSRMAVDQWVLEYATPRAGAIDVLRALPPGRLLGLGAVNPRTDAIESLLHVVGRAESAAAIFGRGGVHLNPDCGFGTFAERPVASARTAFEKLRLLASAADVLRNRRALA